MGSSSAMLAGIFCKLIFSLFSSLINTDHSLIWLPVPAVVGIVIKNFASQSLAIFLAASRIDPPPSAIKILDLFSLAISIPLIHSDIFGFGLIALYFTILLNPS